MNPARPSRERVLLAVGTKTYRHGADFSEPLATLDQVPISLRRVVETLTGLGYQTEPGAADKYLLNPGLQQLREAVRAAAGGAPVVLIYYTGHGLKPEGNPYYLVTTETRPGLLEDTALEARQLLSLVLRKDTQGDVLPDEEQPQVLIVLDCCFSGAGGVESLKESLQGMGNPKVWVLATASSVEWAQQGRFAEALSQALLDPPAGSLQQFLGLDGLLEKVNAVIGQGGQTARYFPPGGESSGLPPFFPNVKYVPGAAGPTITEQHWVGRLRGGPSGDTAEGLYLTGRTGRIQVLEDLARWMRDSGRGGLAVVTGSPGSGKSAMLALPVLLSDGRGQDARTGWAEPGSLAARAADLFAGLPVLGIHARGKNPYQVTDIIAGHLGFSSDSPEELMSDLNSQPGTTACTVVVDAVDEAIDSRRLLSDLLLPLVRRAGLRVIIGARRHVMPPAADTSLLVDLDSDEYRDPQALADYAQQLLAATREPGVPSPYRDRDKAAATVAQVIAEKATARRTPAGQAESFLLAQLLARAIRSRHDILDLTRGDWADQLPASVGEAFDEDLRRLGKREPAARALLTALAWAKGAGLPWETIWVPVAQALATTAGDGAPQLDDAQVTWLLRNAGAYVVEDLGPGGRSVFRPFHDLLAAHLRGQPAEEQMVGEDAWQRRRQRAERDITRVLLDGAPTTPDGGVDWELVHPYVRTYLAQHAQAAGPETFAELGAELDFLAVADPTILTPLLNPTDPALRPIARPYRRARPLLGRSARQNSAYLHEAVVAQTGSRPVGQGIRPTYRTLMARVRRDDSLLTLTGHTEEVEAVAFGTGPDRRLLLASGSRDKAVRLWNPDTGAPVGDPLTGQDGAVVSVAFGTGPGGRLLLASASRFGMVRLWDVVTGVPADELFTSRNDSMRAAGFGITPDGRILLVVSDRIDRTVRLWDLAASAPVGEPLTGSYAPMVGGLVVFGTGPGGRLLLASNYRGQRLLWDALTGALVGQPHTGHIDTAGAEAVGTGPDGRLLMVIYSGSDRMVQLWDLAASAPVGEQFTGLQSQRTVAFGTGPGGRLLLASLSDSDYRMAQLWDPVAGVPVGQPLTGHADTVQRLAFGTGPGGRLLLASGSIDKTVRLWDPVTAAPAGQLTGHDGTVRSVAFGTAPDGRLLLASGSDDRTARLWDPVTGAAVGEPLTNDTIAPNVPYSVWTVAFGTGPGGRLLLATGGGDTDQTVRLWDPLTGALAGQLTGHGREVRSVAFGTGPGGRLLLASVGSDATVRLWDPVTGAPAGQLTGHGGEVRSVAFGTGPGGRLLLASVGSDATVRLWDPVTGAPAGQLTGHDGEVRSVAFGTGPGGRLLLASGSNDATVRLWDPVTGAPAGQLTGHHGEVSSVAFGTGPGGRLLLASGSRDATVRLWDITARSCIATLHRRSTVNSVASAGTLLAIGDDEGISVIEVDL